MTLEVCCQDLASVKAAKEGGADRVELCANLELDGLTPSSQLISEAVETGIRVHVLIRCRAGNFVYTQEEVETMRNSILAAKRLGAKGVVIGCLTKDGSIDVHACQRLIEAAYGLSITFHRAFDVCRSPLEAVRTIQQLGCHRILTSGQQPTALQGARLLRQLVKLNVIPIMAGSGVKPENAAEIVRQTGVNEIHGTLRSLVDGQLQTTLENVQATRKAIDNA